MLCLWWLLFQFKLEANHRINREELKRLERDRHACRRDLSHLQKEPGRYEALAKQYRDLKDDLGKTKKYSEQSRAYADRKAADDEEMQAKIVELEACKETSQVRETLEMGRVSMGEKETN